MIFKHCENKKKIDIFWRENSKLRKTELNFSKNHIFGAKIQKFRKHTKLNFYKKSYDLAQKFKIMKKFPKSTFQKS